MILLIPVFLRLFKIIYYHIYYFFNPINKIIINENYIDLKSETPYVRQLNLFINIKKTT